MSDIENIVTGPEDAQAESIGPFPSPTAEAGSQVNAPSQTHVAALSEIATITAVALMHVRGDGPEKRAFGRIFALATDALAPRIEAKAPNGEVP